jgi:sulfhydrogenase subunit gamma (sulfur reductase)
VGQEIPPDRGSSAGPGRLSGASDSAGAEARGKRGELSHRECRVVQVQERRPDRMKSREVRECHCEAPGRGSYCPVLCKLESVTPLTPLESVFRLVRADGQPFGHRPGQFVELSVFGQGEAPLSVSSSPTRGTHLDLTVRRVGELTAALHELQPGAEVGVRGPFGTWFDTEAMRGQDLLLIAGGCGLAPMRALIQYCQDCRDDFGRVTILYGAKTPEDILYKEELNRWQGSATLSCRCCVDGVPTGQRWDGEVGLITALIPALEVDAVRTTAVVVGPPVMYRFVIAPLKQKGLTPEQIAVSLERYMKCGIGKCGHCAIDHLYVCLDGPVFRLDRIAQVEGALA